MVAVPLAFRLSLPASMRMALLAFSRRIHQVCFYFCYFYTRLIDFLGVYHGWKANTTGKNAKSVLEFLEKNYTDEAVASSQDTIKLAIKALLEVVQGKNLEVAVMERGQRMRVLAHEEIDKFVTQIEKEKEEEIEKKKTKK